MGTRSLTKIIEKCDDGSKETITTMYRQYDGYLDGHGVELAEWLLNFHIVNGISLNETRLIANGMGCLAAQMFAYFKDGPGNIYCMHPNAQDCGEEYLYEIEENNKDILITVYDIWNKKEIFHGTPNELLEHTSVLS